MAGKRRGVADQEEELGGRPKHQRQQQQQLGPGSGSRAIQQMLPGAAIAAGRCGVAAMAAAAGAQAAAAASLQAGAGGRAAVKQPRYAAYGAAAAAAAVTLPAPLEVPPGVSQAAVRLVASLPRGTQGRKCGECQSCLNPQVCVCVMAERRGGWLIGPCGVARRHCVRCLAPLTLSHTNTPPAPAKC